MKKQSGFTLIELVVVIIILGVLSAVAIPKFVSMRNDAKLASINGLKAALETAATFTYARTMIEGADYSIATTQTLSSGIKIRYGYPHATQSNLKALVDISDDWMLANSNPDPVVFAFVSDTEGMTVAEIATSTDICKLVYTRAAKGERPDITISGCSI